MVSSRHALQIMEQGWNSASTVEAHRLHDEARQYLANDAGSKYMSVTIELDKLLEVVAGIAGDVKKEADETLRIVTAVLIFMSLTLSVLVLAVG